MNQETRDLMLLKMAYVVSEQSTCQRRSVGAVLSRFGRPVGIGYNGAPPKVAHCAHTPGETEPCTNAVHAEANAIAFAAKVGVALAGAELHTTDEPCLNCARLIVSAGIVRVVYGRPYRVHDGSELLLMVGVEVKREPRDPASGP